MSATELAREWFHRVWQNREVNAIEELCSLDAVGHLRPCEIVGPAGFVQIWHGFFSAFPDMDLRVEDIFGEGDKAVVRWRAKGTHAGDGLGFPPTNRQIEFTGMTMIREENGKIVEGWDEWDYGRLIAKLGG